MGNSKNQGLSRLYQLSKKISIKKCNPLYLLKKLLDLFIRLMECIFCPFLVIVELCSKFGSHGEEEEQRKKEDDQKIYYDFLKDKQNKKLIDLTSNQVLIQNDPKQPTFYIPAYMRFKMKNFTKINIEDLEAQVNGDIILTVYYGCEFNGIKQMSKNLVKALDKKIILHFSRDGPIKLDEQSIQITKKDDAAKCQLTYTIRKKFNLSLKPEVFWTPIQKILLIITVSIQSISFQYQNDDKKDFSAKIKFNLMDHKNQSVSIDPPQEKHLGYYSFIQTETYALYTNKRIQNYEGIANKKNYRKYQSDKNLHFQYAYFQVGVYKHPTVTIATIFLPLWCLAIINLGIFFQENELSQRIASIASIMVAFIALIPTIRDQIPNYPTIVFIQILVYLQVGANILGFVHSLIRSIEKEKYLFHWRQDYYFLCSLYILILEILCVVIMLLRYVSRKRKYTNPQKQNIKKSFKRQNWGSQNCDTYFLDLIMQKFPNSLAETYKNEIQQLKKLEYDTDKREKFIQLRNKLVKKKDQNNQINQNKSSDLKPQENQNPPKANQNSQANQKELQFKSSQKYKTDNKSSIQSTKSQQNNNQTTNNSNQSIRGFQSQDEKQPLNGSQKKSDNSATKPKNSIMENVQ